MFRHSDPSAAECVIVAPLRVSSVRLLETPEELRAAVERAREFEQTRAADQGAAALRYKRYLSDHSENQGLAEVVPIDSDVVGA